MALAVDIYVVPHILLVAAVAAFEQHFVLFAWHVPGPNDLVWQLPLWPSKHRLEPRDECLLQHETTRPHSTP